MDCFSLFTGEPEIKVHVGMKTKLIKKKNCIQVSGIRSTLRARQLVCHCDLIPLSILPHQTVIYYIPCLFKYVKMVCDASELGVSGANCALYCFSVPLCIIPGRWQPFIRQTLCWPSLCFHFNAQEFTKCSRFTSPLADNTMPVSSSLNCIVINASKP